MKLLLIHADYFEYNVKKETKITEKIDDSNRSKLMKDLLVVFTSVELNDINKKEILNRTVDEIINTAKMVHTNDILIYPYAHLSSDLAMPSDGLIVLKEIEYKLKSYNNLNIERAPFGCYKEFSIKCKGHPLSELSKSITSSLKNDDLENKTISSALKIEKDIKSEWKILDINGKLYNTNKFDYSNHNKLESFINYEISKNRLSNKTPPHVELMKKLEIADYEPGSDSGNMRYYPKGRFIKSLLENYILEKSREYGAMEVETPIMYDMNHPTLKKYLDRFPARQYSIESDKRHLFLRFAACFGQFLINHDMTISHKNLPLKMIELTRYSFRKEQRGELVGLRRLRSFTMPDMHTLVYDIEYAKKEFLNQYRFCINILKEIGLEESNFEIAIRMTSQFYSENNDLINEMVNIVKKPVLIEIWNSKFFYFVLKFELNFIDNLNKASALSTVQIDVENAERYDIKYTSGSGKLEYPTILHCSPSGAIERCIYALLEKSYFDIENNKIPMPPLWISPTQVRLVPVSSKHINYSEEICQKIKYRVDIDDRELTLGKKIRDANKEWIPFIVVIGDDEVNSNKLSVTIRSKSTVNNYYTIKMTISDLNELLYKELNKYPYKSIPLDIYLSKRPKFI